MLSQYLLAYKQESRRELYKAVDEAASQSDRALLILVDDTMHMR